MFKTYWSIFWRTFAQLAVPAVIAAQSYDWYNGNARVNATLLSFALLVAAIGGLAAAGYAWVTTPATTVLQKATRSAVEAALGVLVALPVNATSDIVKWPPLIVGGISVVVGAFVLTFFQNQVPAPAPVEE
jgi:hypothetical protein